MEDAPETPDTFLGYPCRATQRFAGILHVALVLDERWLLAMFQKNPTGSHMVILYKCKIDPNGLPVELFKTANGLVADELGMFNWARKQLEELDGRRT